MNILDDLKMQYKIGGFEQKIIYWNIGTFLVSILFFYQFKLGGFNFPNWISLSSNPTIALTRPWTVLTYSFFHGGFFYRCKFTKFRVIIILKFKLVYHF